MFDQPINPMHRHFLHYLPARIRMGCWNVCDSYTSLRCVSLIRSARRVRVLHSHSALCCCACTRSRACANGFGAFFIPSPLHLLVPIFLQSCVVVHCTRVSGQFSNHRKLSTALCSLSCFPCRLLLFVFALSMLCICPYLFLYWSPFSLALLLSVIPLSFPLFFLPSFLPLTLSYFLSPFPSPLSPLFFFQGWRTLAQVQ